jgi:hypothetical protein
MINMGNYDKFSAEDNYPQKKHKKIYAKSKKIYIFAA